MAQLKKPTLSKKKQVDKYDYDIDLGNKAMQYFISKGLEPHQAAGLVGNLVRESRLNADSTNSSSKAYGIAQWLGDRKKALFAKYGNTPTLENQLDYVWHELNNTHKRGLKYLKLATTPEQAARYGMGYYEFMGGPDAAIREMKKYGQNGEVSMAEGIEFANRLLKNYVPAKPEPVVAADYDSMQYNPPVVKVPIINNEYNPDPHYGVSRYIDRNTAPAPSLTIPYEKLMESNTELKNMMMRNLSALLQ